jgi:hypothetical protein
MINYEKYLLKDNNNKLNESQFYEFTLTKDEFQDLVAALSYVVHGKTPYGKSTTLEKLLKKLLKTGQ